MKNKKRERIFALIMSLLFLSSMVILSSSRIFAERPVVSSELNESDKKIAEDLSNLTGVSLKEIAQLKNQWKDWNEVIRLLSTRYKRTINKESLDEIMGASELGEELIKKLKDQGFDNSAIYQMKTRIQRLQYQLDEILSYSDSVSKVPNPSTLYSDKKDSEESLDEYQELIDKIQLKTAVYIALMLRISYGTDEAAIDEYLCSLHLNIDLEKYLNDLEGYKKVKESSITAEKDIINLEKIERKLLETIEKNNKKQLETEGQKTTSAAAGEKGKYTGDSINDILPGINSTTPNPQQDIFKEINEIKHRSFN